MADPNTETTTVGGYGTLESPITIGGATTDVIGFYGTTPVDQGAAVTTVTTTPSTTTAPFGYCTSTQADAIVTAVNALIARLNVATGVGLIA